MDELHYNTTIKILISHDFPINRVPYILANSLHSPLDSVPWEQGYALNQVLTVLDKFSL